MNGKRKVCYHCGNEYFVGFLSNLAQPLLLYQEVHKSVITDTFSCYDLIRHTVWLQTEESLRNNWEQSSSVRH